MALSDLQVFNEYMYSAMTETLDVNINLFNQATRGGIVLRSAMHQGDYTDAVIYAKIAGLVRRRNAYGSGAVAEKVIQQLVETSVKVAAGTPPVRIDPGMMKWIARSPEEAGVVVGRQLAGDMMQDMLARSAAAYIAAMGAQAAVYYDHTATGAASLTALNTGRAKLGDRADDVACWLLHSKSLFDIYGAAITNSNVLFSFGNIKVTHDGFGNPFIVSDLAPLTAAGPVYFQLGLVPGAIFVDQNDDFTANTDTINGDENIKRTFQAEWTFNLALKGFAWDKTNGGHSPTDNALSTATNWDKYATSSKDLAGVLVKTT